MKPRVLLVDDDPLVLSSMVRLLGAHCGVSVLATRDPIYALDCLNAVPNGIDVIVSDYALPGLNGIHLLAICMERWPNMRRVIYTGSKDWSAPFADVILLKGNPAKDIADTICKLAQEPRGKARH